MPTVATHRSDHRTLSSAPISRAVATRILAGLLGTLYALSTQAADTGHGFFRMGGSGIEVTHVAAVKVEEGIAAESDRLHVYLADFPLDAAKLAAAFDSEDAARDQLGDRAGGYVRLCITADGGECGLFYLRRQPDDSFNTSGYGEMTLATHGPARVAGRWVLAKPESFFDETYLFDLDFDVAITPAPGVTLPDGGGDAGAAYRTWADTVARGDVAALRRMLGEDAHWRLPGDDADRVKETLKSLRDGQPLRPDILRGRLDGDDAVLWVDGVDRDDIRRQGRVLMRRAAGTWTFVESDLDSVDE